MENSSPYYPFIVFPVDQHLIRSHDVEAKLCFVSHLLSDSKSLCVILRRADVCCSAQFQPPEPDLH
eukprot:13630240-Heterocapsa_arctica.AAC.1